uniref:NADH-ubiquinone oxidoreductase chain 2 n=1 Tax=Psenopsis anomala TaxID=163124 RepID=R9RGP3_PSEAK|nr:NADH dehydrogenase subunit 2 [Psenopsis anomala]AGM48299.1 NADH dehydrogenase subunit 2 [Psenopsis anomala]
MNPYVLSHVIPSLGLGTLITLISSHWLLAWMGLEISTLSMIPVMTGSRHPRAIEAAAKYFLTQASAGATLLFGAATNAWITGQWAIEQTPHPIAAIIMTIALAMKLGLAPLHTWLPEVLQGLDFDTGLILVTWQKLAPLVLLAQIPQDTPALLTTLGLLSILVGGLGGMNQTLVRKILGYSSISNIGWMALAMHYSHPLVLLTLVTYIIMTCTIFMLFKEIEAKSIKCLANAWARNPVFTACIPLVLLSLAGLPPLTGFMPKWLIILKLCEHNLAFLATVAALSALLSLRFYLQLIYAMMTIMPSSATLGSKPWRLRNRMGSMTMGLGVSASLFLTPLIPILLVFLSP